MSYQIIPNLIFFFSIFGMVLLILRRLPEANAQVEQELAEPLAHDTLIKKGLPALGSSKAGVFVKSNIKKFWDFALEAKDLKPKSAAGYRMKKIFGGKLPGTKPEIVKPQTFHEVKTESYFLDNIKLEPKNLKHYDALGKFYLEKESVSDARDIYQYLVNHEPQNAEFHARLAYCFYTEKNFNKAAEHYQKSVELDSTHPNRYYNLGLSQEALGELEKAAESLEHAIELEPTLKYYNALGDVYSELGNTQKAKQVQLKAKKLKGLELEAKKKENT